MVNADHEGAIKVRYIAGYVYSLAKTKYVAFSLAGVIPYAVKTAGRHYFGGRFCFLTTYTRSLSDLGVRSEASGKSSRIFPNFEAHSGATQREIGGNWADFPPPQ